MKTLNLKNIMSITATTLLLLTVACDKKSDNPAPAAPTHTYNYVNGTCYNTTTNTPAAANLCTNNVVNGNYRWNGTQCTDLAGNIVNQTLCQSGVNGSYRWNGSQCVNGSNQPVAQNLCTNGNGAQSYRWNGVACTDYNGLAVAPELCSTSGGLGGQYQLGGGECYSGYNWVPYSFCNGQGGYVTGQCNGTYIKYGGGSFGSYYYTKYCSGTSCRGETLLEYYTRRPVVCR